MSVTITSLDHAKNKIEIGAFEVTVKGVKLFSKLELGYFPHTTALTDRIEAFIQDMTNGKDLSKYKFPNSPIKSNPNVRA